MTAVGPAPSDGLWELVTWRARQTPDRVMLVDEQDRRTTFAQLRDEALSCSAALGPMTAAERVVWQLPTCTRGCVLAAALAHRGALQVPVLPSARERDLSVILDEVAPRLLVVPDRFGGFDHAGMAERLASERPGLQVLVLGSDPAPAADPRPFGEQPAPRVPDAGPGLEGAPEARWVFFTSGTTGRPKGVVHSDATVAAAARGMIGALGIDASDRHAIVFPLTHVGGIVWLMVGLMVGLPQLVIEAFSAETAIPSMRRFGVTLAGAGTAFHLAYLAAQRAAPDHPVLPDVRAFPGGAAPKPITLHDEMRTELGAPVVSGYGLTECPILSMNRPTDPDEKLATTEGRALRGVSIRVASVAPEEGAGGESSPTGAGELLVRGPQLFLGYLGSAGGSSAGAAGDTHVNLGTSYRSTLDPDGYLHTGDLGRLDAEGFVTVTGRLKDVIIRKGETIAAKEIEDELYDHPDVAEVAVIGWPDPVAGERVCAVVVPADRERPPTLPELVAHLEGRGLMRHQWPERLAYQDALPVGPAGKVLKEELRRRVADQLSETGPKA